MNFVAEHFGRIDCVVNNAGAGGEGGPIAETSVEGFNQSIALLLGGTFFGIKYSVQHMKARRTRETRMLLYGIHNSAPSGMAHRRVCATQNPTAQGFVGGFASLVAYLKTRWPTLASK
jgi:NAD(P)-dependent dehydrogenase (short-subunit alcohol dehydrogenase family)